MMDEILTAKNVKCRACGVIVKCLGKLAKIEGVFDLLDSGCLYRCFKCGLYFRYPYLSSSDLKNMYLNLKADFWAEDEERRDFKIARDLIQSRIKTGKILDVGCFRGDFLGSLGKSYKKYGVELSSEAAEIAKYNGITLVASDIDALQSVSETFDVITMIDVVEHLIDPLLSLQKVWDKLNSEGLLVIATGNTDALPWRLQRLSYWYYYPDHVCFFNPHWFRWAVNKLGGSIQGIEKFSHFEGTFGQRFYQLRYVFKYSVVLKARQFVVANSWLGQLYPVSWVKELGVAPKSYLWKDHMLLVLKKQ